MSEQREPEGFSVVLFSGTDDKLTAASILIAGAAALGKRVDVLLQYWALEAFQADRITKDHGLAPEAGSEGSAALWRAERAARATSTGATRSGRRRRSARCASTRAPTRWRSSAST